MGTELIANLFATALAKTCGVTDTKIVVSDSAPESLQVEGGQFRVRVGMEFMLVTSGFLNNGKEWAVTRQVEEPNRFPATEHAQGASVTHLVTTGAFKSVASAEVRSEIAAEKARAEVAEHVILGLADPTAAPYGAKCDGITDDTAAFTRLIEAINAGTAKGFYLTATAKIKGSLPAITREVEIRRFANAQLDFSESTATAGLTLEGSYGAHSPLTENAVFGAYTLKVGTAYPDGTMLKIVDPTTVWDAEQKAHPGEILETGVPDGPLSGINGASNTPAGIQAGEAITAITIAAVNAKGIFGAAGTITVGTETFAYTAVEQTESFTKLTVTEKVAVQNHPQGTRVALVPEPGTVYLRMPVSHELGYTVGQGCYVEPLTMVGPSLIEATIKGPSEEAFTGIAATLCNRLTLSRPSLLECWQQGIRLFDCTWWHVDEPFVTNARYIAFAGGGNGYGVYAGFCSQDGEVTGGRTIRTRHSYTQGSTPANGFGLPRRNKVLDHQSISAFAAAFDSHAGANDITFIGCSALQPNGSIYSIHCPKALVADGRGTRPGGSGIAATNRTKGSTEYDFADFDFIQPAENGVTVRSEGAEWGSSVKYIRIRGAIDSPTEYGVQVEGSGEGNTINWLQKNVDIDVTVSNGPTAGPYQAVSVNSAENVRIRVQGSGTKANNDIVKLRDVKHYTVQMGACGWAETSTGVACRVTVGVGGGEGNSTDGEIYEGPLTNGGSNSTKLETGVTHTLVYTGPDSNISLGTGTGNEILEGLGAGRVSTNDLAARAVTGPKIATQTLNSEHIEPKSLTGTKLENHTVGPEQTKQAVAPTVGANGEIKAGEVGVPKRQSFSIVGNGTRTEWETEHALNTYEISAQFQEATSGHPGKILAPSESRTAQAIATNKAKIVFSAAPAAGTVWYVTLIG